jgi:hypothetical protein
MTREQVYLFITKTPTHYRDSNPGPLVLQPGPQTTRPAGRRVLNRYWSKMFGIGANNCKTFFD